MHSKLHIPSLRTKKSLSSTHQLRQRTTTTVTFTDDLFDFPEFTSQLNVKPFTTITPALYAGSPILININSDDFQLVNQS